MKIHHLNCATICPRIPHSLLGGSCVICHCLLIETSNGLVLVDTGLGTLDIQHPVERLGHVFTKLINPRLDREETALRHIEKLGFKREDVRHIVMTHLDVDHAGGISDFPSAQIHLLEGEYEAAMKRQLPMGELRYHSVQWAHDPKWVRHSIEGERWFGFESVRALPGSQDEILLVPLFGHTRGHCGVAVRSAEGWLLHAGDAYFSHSEMNLQKPSCPPALAAFQRLMQTDGAVRLENQRRLRALKAEHAGGIDIFCAHDPVDLERFTSSV